MHAFQTFLLAQQGVHKHTIDEVCKEDDHKMLNSDKSVQQITSNRWTCVLVLVVIFALVLVVISASMK